MDESGAMFAGNVASNDSRARSLSAVVRGNPDSPLARSAFDLMPGEELWVIAKGFTSTPQPPEDRPRSGCLMAKLPDVEKEVGIPLKHTSVTGNIDGYIASVDVTQQFQNPYS